MTDAESAPLILASRSEVRASLLRAAGVAVEVVPARVDEAAVKAGLAAEGAAPRDVADALAELKARRVAARAPGMRVLGADQVLVCEGRLFDKPVSRAEAGEQLAFLRGRTHELLSAAVIFEGGAPVWRHVGRAVLRVRPFSDAFLDDYLARQGEALLATVGAYRLEAEGAQLFSHVQGDYFTILGLPLLEVLGFLRTRGVILE
jgi:septum formation protein